MAFKRRRSVRSEDRAQLETAPKPKGEKLNANQIFAARSVAYSLTAMLASFTKAQRKKILKFLIDELNKKALL